MVYFTYFIFFINIITFLFFLYQCIKLQDSINALKRMIDTILFWGGSVDKDLEKIQKFLSAHNKIITDHEIALKNMVAEVKQKENELFSITPKSEKKSLPN